MTDIIDEAPPCQNCAHYKRDDAADPINRDLCQIGPVNARYQRDEHCFGKWFIWRDGAKRGYE